MNDIIDMSGKISVALLGEARSETYNEMLDIANVILARMQYPAYMFDHNGDSNGDGLPDFDDILKQFYGYEMYWTLVNPIERDAMKRAVKASITACSSFDIDSYKSFPVFYATKKRLHNCSLEEINKIFTKYHKIREVEVPEYYAHRFFALAD